MTVLRRSKLVLLIALLVVVPGLLPAQDKPLRVSLLPAAVRNRSNAPFELEVVLDWSGTNILEGQLDLVFMSGNKVAGRYRSGDIALTTGEQSFRMMLPPMRSDAYDSELEVQVQFLTGKTKFDFGRRFLFAPVRAERSLVICVSRPQSTLSDRHFNVVRSMALERFDPKESERAGASILTSIVGLHPEDFPAYPLGYCCCDIVLLTEEGFSLLQEKHLGALSRWVQAGGSVCVVPGRNLKPYHIAFLNDLSASSKTSHNFILDENGCPVPVSAFPDSGIGMYYTGLGRMVVVMKLPPKDELLTSRDWKEAVAFLWKIRTDQAGSILFLGKWQTSEGKVSGGWRYQETFAALPDSIAGDILRDLMPQTIRIIPLWMLVLILAIFVAVIGPIDYFLLGLFRVRRFTWLLFPLVSIGFTIFAVYLSEHYMGTADYRGALVFVDVGRGGRVLRQNRYELLFTAGEKVIDTEVKKALFMPLVQRSFDRWGDYGDYESGESAETRYEGRIPTTFKVSQRIRQWTPQLNRFFSMEPVRAKINLNWDAITSGSREQARIVETIFGKESPYVDIYIIPPPKRSKVWESDEYDPATNSRTRKDIYTFSKARDFRKILDRDVLPRPSLLLKTSLRDPAGLFSVVSQISPTGGSNFEDLTVLDPTDPEQWLLAVVVREGNDIIIYRRLYYGEE